MVSQKTTIVLFKFALLFCLPTSYLFRKAFIILEKMFHNELLGFFTGQKTETEITQNLNKTRT